MATIKNHDFVEIDYTGRVKEDNSIFDTTEEKVAKDEGIFDKEHEHGPIVICVGENTLLKSLEERLVGKETDKEYTVEIKAEDAFGKKDARLLQMIPLNKFRKQNIQPVPGLQLNIDGVFGIVKTVSGGRCYVDFNHPLAGKDLVYNVKIKRIVEDEQEKLKALLDNLHMHDAKIEMKEGTAEISSKHDVPKEIQEELKKNVEKTIPTIKGISFAKKQ